MTAISSSLAIHTLSTTCVRQTRATRSNSFIQRFTLEPQAIAYIGFWSLYRVCCSECSAACCIVFLFDTLYYTPGKLDYIITEIDPASTWRLELHSLSPARYYEEIHHHGVRSLSSALFLGLRAPFKLQQQSIKTKCTDAMPPASKQVLPANIYLKAPAAAISDREECHTSTRRHETATRDSDHVVPRISHRDRSI